MKYLIVGLGNMGAEYDGTRHNIGFEVLDAMAEEQSLSWAHERLADKTEYKYKGRKLILLKPSTFVNLSGKAVSYWMNQERIHIEKLLIIVDDLKLDFGTLRLKSKGSHGGHNGLKSIEAVLNSKGYPRLRFGIGQNFPRGRQVDYVLGKWKEKEREALPSYLADAQTAIHNFIFLGMERAMNLCN